VLLLLAGRYTSGCLCHVAGSSSHGSSRSQRTHQQRLRSIKETTCARGWVARYRLTVQHWREAAVRAWRGMCAVFGSAVRSVPGVNALIRFSKRRRGLSASTSTGSMRRTGSDLFESQAGAGDTLALTLTLTPNVNPSAAT